MKQQLKIPAFLRYVDDMILLANSKAQLWNWCEQIEQFLGQERLTIHPDKKLLVPVHEGLDVLGYRVFPKLTRLSRGSGYKFRRKLHRFAKAYAENRMELDEIQPHVAGWLGHARQADSKELCSAIFSEVSFVRGTRLNDAPGGSGRFVEQQPTELAFGQSQQEQHR